MNLYFVRHGVTREHENKKSQKPGSPLSKEGERQAKLLGRRLKKQHYNFDMVFASPFERARKTAEIICKELQAPYEEMDVVHEMKNPDHLLGKGRGDSVFDKYLKELFENGRDLDWKFNREGESLRDVLLRAQEFEKHLLEKHLGQDVLTVSHGTFGRCFIANCILDGEFDDEAFVKVFQSMKMDNTGLTLLEYEEDEKIWRVRFLNDHSHLFK
jgi:probable phosphoglycerate mutase